MTDDILMLNASALLTALKAREISATEVTKAYLKAIESTARLNNYVCVTPEHALRMARISDAQYASGDAGPLEGLPIGIKDLFCTKDIPTTACSAILKNFIPPYESTVTAHLWRDGAVMLGKLNCDEFAMGSTNETSIFGPAINAWRAPAGPDLTPGGSSGGSASAVAAGSALMTIGTDTGGSIRQPAAFCGVVGMKPSYGRCSRWGIVAFASSLDQAGPFTRIVADSALLFTSMAGHDAKDSTSSQKPLPPLTEHLNKGVKGLKIGIPSEYFVDGMDSAIIDLWQQGQDWLKDAGADIIPLSLPHTKYALPCYYIIAPAEASSNLARYDGVRYGVRATPDKPLAPPDAPDDAPLDMMYEASRAAGFGDEVQRRILMGTYVLSAGYYDAYYLKAQQVRRLICNDFDAAFQKVDAILTPTTPSAAFPLGTKHDDPITIYLNDIFTVPANLAGLPGISVPSGLTSDNLPLGLQLLTPHFREDILYQVAACIERQANFTARPPHNFKERS